MFPRLGSELDWSRGVVTEHIAQRKTFNPKLMYWFIIRFYEKTAGGQWKRLISNIYSIYDEFSFVRSKTNSKTSTGTLEKHVLGHEIQVGVRCVTERSERFMMCLHCPKLVNKNQYLRNFEAVHPESLVNDEEEWMDSKIKSDVIKYLNLIEFLFLPP